MSKEKLKRKEANLTERNSKDISSEDLLLETINITMVHNANFGGKQLDAFRLLNVLVEHRFEGMLPKLSVER